MNESQAIELARQHALRYGQRGSHPYLPKTKEDACDWLPHEWVIGAIVAAAELAVVHEAAGGPVAWMVDEPPWVEQAGNLTIHHSAHHFASNDYSQLERYRNDGRSRITPLYAAPVAAKVNAEMLAALSWYAEQARLCRLIPSEGDARRNALAADGGNRARTAIAIASAEAAAKGAPK